MAASTFAVHQLFQKLAETVIHYLTHTFKTFFNAKCTDIPDFETVSQNSKYTESQKGQSWKGP